MSFPRVVTVSGWFVVVVAVVVVEVAALWVLIFFLNARYLSLLLPGCVADCQYGLRSLETQIYFGHYFRFRHRRFRVHPREPRLCYRMLMCYDTWHSWDDPLLMLWVLMRTGPVIRFGFLLNNCIPIGEGITQPFYSVNSLLITHSILQ